MGTARKLLGVCQDLAALEEQGEVEGFVNNVRNADKLGGLVEDIRDGMMEYQVCARKLSISSMSDICTRLRYSKIFTTRVVGSSLVSFPCLSPSQTNRWIGINGPHHSQRNATHCGRQLPLWGQAGVSEGNKEGDPLGD